MRMLNLYLKARSISKLAKQAEKKENNVETYKTYFNLKSISEFIHTSCQH